MATGYASTLTFTDLEGLWNNAGGNPKYAQLAAAIALAESGGRVDATNHNTNGTTDIGLWQINTIHGAQASFDPATNARAAVAISGNGASFRPWCTAWSDGACGTKGGTYLGPGTPAITRFNEAVKGGSADLNPGTIPGAKTPQITDKGTLNLEHGCVYSSKINLAVTSTEICWDATLSILLMAAGGLVMFGGLAVLVVAVAEKTPAGRAATQALAVATPVGRIVKGVSRARSASNTPAASEQAGQARVEAQRAAEARREAAEARRRTEARRRARHANAQEKRRQDLHSARVANINARTMSTRGRSFSADDVDKPAARRRPTTRHLPPGSPAPF